MRIGVNLLFLVPGHVGGSEPLLTNVLRALGTMGGDTKGPPEGGPEGVPGATCDPELVIFALRGFCRAHPDLAERFSVVEIPWSRNVQPLRIAAEHSWLPIEAARRRLDLVHHGVGTAPFLKTLPTVVTIHDIQYRHYPRNFSPAKRAWLSANVPLAARRSEVVCVPSRFVADDLVRSFRIDPEDVVVVPFGSQGLLGSSPAAPGQARERYRLERPFFLFPGTAYPHKNHRFLIRAYAPLAAEADLVLTGPPWPHDDRVFEEVRRLDLRDRVRHLGVVPREDLGGLYRAAAALAYPTRFEGFGAPALEAMSLGCPVIASNAAAVPEVVGEAGVLLDPDDLEGWTRALGRILDDETHRRDLARRGLARAAEFSWERAGRLQLSAYEKALSR
jgi:glycosyltransferase involved in cell wall biosynthesis